MNENPRWTMKGVLAAAASRTADILPLHRIDFNALHDEIREAERLLRVADFEVEKAGMTLQEAQNTRQQRTADLTELHQRWFDESCKMGLRVASAPPPLPESENG